MSDAPAALTPLSAIRDQARVIGALTTMLARRDDPVPPLLFHGPGGCGKRSTALAFCASLVCLTPRATDACGECRTCSRIRDGHEITALRSGSHSGDTPRQYPDAGFISIPSGKTRVSILQARDIVLSLQQQPYELSRRLYIVDPADSMTPSAANALLKILEEPPAHAVLILVSAAPWSLPITVRSRLTALRFRPLSRETVEQLLASEMPRREAAARAALSGGSLERALAVDPERHAQQLKLWCDLLARLARGDRPAALAVNASEAFASDAETARAALEQLLEVLRDIAAAATGSAARLISDEQAAQLAPLAERCLGPSFNRAVAVERLRSELIVFNRNPRLAVEGAVLALSGHVDTLSLGAS